MPTLLPVHPSFSKVYIYEYRPTGRDQDYSLRGTFSILCNKLDVEGGVLSKLYCLCFQQALKKFSTSFPLIRHSVLLRVEMELDFHTLYFEILRLFMLI